MKNNLVLGEIPRWTKEMIFVAISMDRACGYCAAAHTACCRMLGVGPQTLTNLVRDVNNISDAKIRDMILFSIKCSKNPQGLLDSDIAKLLQPRPHDLASHGAYRDIGVRRVREHHCRCHGHGC